MWVKHCFLKAYLTISQPAVKGSPATVRNVGGLCAKGKKKQTLPVGVERGCPCGEPPCPTPRLGTCPLHHVAVTGRPTVAPPWPGAGVLLWDTPVCAATAAPAVPGKACIVLGRTAVPLASLPSFTSIPSCSHLGGTWAANAGMPAEDDKEEPKMQRLRCRNYKWHGGKV